MRPEYQHYNRRQLLNTVIVHPGESAIMSQQTAESETLEALASLPTKAQPTVSYGGDRIALYCDVTGRNELHVLRACGGPRPLRGRCDSLRLRRVPSRHGAHGLACSADPAGSYRHISTKLRRIVSPVSPDFSGWNCVPKTLPASLATMLGKSTA